MTTIETLTVLLSVSTGQTNITAGLNPAVMLYYWAIWRDVIPLHLSGMIRFFKIPKWNWQLLNHASQVKRFFRRHSLCQGESQIGRADRGDSDLQAALA